MTNAIGWTLLHFCWEGALLAAILAFTLAVLRRARPQARYAAACATLAAMVAAPLWTFLRISAAPEVPLLTSPARDGGHAGARALIPALAGPADSAAPWIALCWLAGVAMMTIRWGAAWIVLQRRLREASPAPPAGLAEALERVRVRMRIAPDIPVRMADWVESPAVSRWIRPVLLVPAAAVAGMGAEQLEAVLAHELAHIRRHDYLVNLTQTAIETLLFYHPAVWWVSRRIRAEREHCCDDVAVTACRDRLVYATALARLEEQRRAQPELVLAAGGGSLKRRIQRVLYPRETAASSVWPASALLFSMAALFLWTGMRVVAQVPEGPYSKWLNEDVVYIITDSERAEFEKLSTDAQREQFIASFWQRRPANFKEEHYRRIAYANDRFAGATPGWKTDRGHIYIVFGPPDEIESHPSQRREAWRYRKNDVIFEFRDGKLSSAP